MGGIGQAAIALANNVGAEIYATAGSESKREQLLALGVRAAFDSHSEDWYDGLMTATGGQGVDVVLNSLAGRHVSLCLEALRAGGWHCEIGKVDIFADSALGLRVFRKNLRFAAIDLDRLMVDDPLLSRELSEACPRPARRRRGAALAGHRLPLRRLCEGAPPHDFGPAPGQAGAEGAARVRRSRLSHRRPAAAPGPGGHLSRDRRLGRLRPAAAALPRDGRRPPPSP